jgi:hypothetical protein
MAEWFCDRNTKYLSSIPACLTSCCALRRASVSSLTPLSQQERVVTEGNFRYPPLGEPVILSYKELKELLRSVTALN